MSKACIFDFDGVLIDNETSWEADKPGLFRETYGESVASRLTGTLGMNMEAIHALAVSHGAAEPYDRLLDAFNRNAAKIYATAPLTGGMDRVVESLVRDGFLLAVVSASPRSWIDTALNRMPDRRPFRVVVSLNDRPDLRPKPAPDGYLEAMKQLGVSADRCVVVEDSRAGILSAKASGAFAVCLSQNHVAGYTVEGADAYAKSSQDILTAIPEHL